MKVEVAHDSTLLDTNVPEAEKLYGYHRLEDPLVMSVSEGNLTITRQSESTPPEPLDTDSDRLFLYGRHDTVVPLQEVSNV